MTKQLPTAEETVLGVFLHDIGKFLQRADGGNRQFGDAVWNRRAEVLPSREGRLSHWHALWTEQFFHWLEEKQLGFPGHIDREQVRRVAVYHHNPDTARSEIGAVGWLAATADRLSAGMERKQRDEEAEAQAYASRNWAGYITTPLTSPFVAVNLGRDNAPLSSIPLAELLPGAGLIPQTKIDTSDYPQRYRELRRKFEAQAQALFAVRNPDVFAEGLLSLSERFLFAVPSSTNDEPDISLHDHSRLAAALAAALYGWHSANGTLDDEAAVKDNSAAKFRFLIGDLSGIQTALFRLASQQVRGVNKILRARSFLMSMLIEAAALLARRAFGLTVFSVLQSAGGRFLMLVPNTPDAERKTHQLRTKIERWMWNRYLGELALNIALSEPFTGNDLLHKFPDVLTKMAAAVDQAKLHPFSTCLQAVHREISFPNGPCKACGARPGLCREERDGESEFWRCRVCDEEHRFGGQLPKANAIVWRIVKPSGAAAEFFGELWLSLEEFQDKPPLPAQEICSLARIYRRQDTLPGPLALRFLAGYVPLLREDELDRYRGAVEEEVEPGELKTFGHLSVDALRRDDGLPSGVPLLMTLKADVDRLGMIFSHGLGDRASLSRYAALSRMMDFFFTGHLQELLRSDFPNTYTVYAGGDDLLLIGPWHDMLRLADRMQAEFRAWTGGNPSLTISAGLEFMKVNEPLNRVVRRAELRLEQAKDAGRNCVSALAAEPSTWGDFRKSLAVSEQLDAWLRSRRLSTGFVYQLLYFEELRRHAEAKQVQNLDALSWRAKLGYQLRRNVSDNSALCENEKTEITRLLCSLLGLDDRLQKTEQHPLAKVPVSIALYRNRNFEKER